MAAEGGLHGRAPVSFMFLADLHRSVQPGATAAGDPHVEAAADLGDLELESFPEALEKGAGILENTPGILRPSGKTGHLPPGVAIFIGRRLPNGAIFPRQLIGEVKLLLRPFHVEVLKTGASPFKMFFRRH